MTNSFAFALVLALVAAPAAAQPSAGSVGPGPLGLGPVGPGPGPLGIQVGVQGGPGSLEQSPLLKLTVPPLAELEAMQLKIEKLDMLHDLPSLKHFEAFDRLHELKSLTTSLAPLEKLSTLGLDVQEKVGAVMDLGLIDHARSMAGHVAFEFHQGREGEVRDREAELREREREREAQWYAEGQNAADQYRWDRALDYFNRVIALKGSKLDAALYWKAFAQNRLGQRTEALATIAELSKSHASSPYRRQANVLEAEVRRDIGQPVRPQDSADDDVKLMALQALQNTAPEEAIPMLEKVLEGTSSRKVKQRALFVLAQSKSPRAREVLRNYAKGASTPDLQSQAIQYLGVHGGVESRSVLAEVYGTTSDVDVKRRILRAFMVSGDRERLFKAAQGEQSPELRAEAVMQLGNMQAHEELSQLYQKESSIDVKRRILRAMGNGGSIDRLIELAKAEQNPELRRDAIRMLGNMRSARTSDVLVQIYGSDTNVDVRKAVITALGNQENATALVALARKEQDINLKKDIVSRLSHMRSKVALDYMVELLGK